MILKNKIQLGEEVMVSDPCYSIGTWCQIKLSNVLPGFYARRRWNKGRQD